MLFKLSFDLPSVLNIQIRSLNLIPFAGSPQSHAEMITNFVVFVPLGLLLGVNFRHTSFWRKLAFVFLFSLIAEVIQFVLAIGITDITDVITNTVGGFFGLALYGLGSKYVDEARLDRFIVVVGTALFIAVMVLRIFVLRVRY